MRLAVMVWSVWLASGVEAQQRPEPRMDFPAPEPAAGHRPVRGVGIWWWRGGGWSFAEPARAVPKAEPEKAAPAYVVNRDYVAERYTPRMTEVAAAGAAAVPLQWTECRVMLVSGERMEGAKCAEVDDSLLVRTVEGRRYRFSLDLVASIQR